MMDLSKEGYEVAEGATFVTRPEWNGWCLPLPPFSVAFLLSFHERAVKKYLHDRSNEMATMKLSLEAMRKENR
jgi:hypothetical protein